MGPTRKKKRQARRPRQPPAERRPATPILSPHVASGPPGQKNGCLHAGARHERTGALGHVRGGNSEMESENHIETDRSTKRVPTDHNGAVPNGAARDGQADDRMARAEEMVDQLAEKV